MNREKKEKNWSFGSGKEAPQVANQNHRETFLGGGHLVTRRREG